MGASSLLAASGPARAGSGRSPGRFPLFGFLGWYSLHNYPTFADAVAAVDAAGGGVLYVPPGVYPCGYPEAAVPVPRNPLVLCGAGPEVSIIDGGGEDSLIGAGGRITVRDLTIRNFAHMAVRVADPVDFLEVSNVLFRNVGQDAFGTILYGAVGVSGETFAGPIHDVRVSRCTFEDCYGGVNLRADEIKDVDIGGNLFTDLKRWAVRIGDDPDTIPDANIRWNIHDNIVDRVVNEQETEIHAFFCFGRSVSIRGNIVTEIRGKKVRSDERPDCEGIYVKCIWSDVSHNLLTNAGYSEAAIILKGRQRGEPNISAPGFATRIEGNTILFDDGADKTSDIVGIQIETDDVICANNYVEGATRGGIRVERNAPGVVIRSNTVTRTYESRPGRSPVGLFSHGDHAILEGNVVSETKHTAGGTAFGILLSAFDLDRENVTVRNNEIRGLDGAGGCYGLYFSISGGVKMRYVRVAGNTFMAAGVGILFDAESSVMEDCRLTDNDFIGLAEDTRNKDKVLALFEADNRSL